MLWRHVFRRADDGAVLGEDRRFDEPMVRRLREAEVDDLGRGRSILQCDQHVAGLEVAVHDALQVRVLHAGADLLEQVDALLERQLVAVAVVRDGDALHVFHRKPRLPRRREPRVEHLRDRRVLHQRERLALRLEARDHGLAVHAELDDLDRGAAADGFFLLGEVDGAHAALADHVEDFEGAELGRAVGGRR